MTAPMPLALALDLPRCDPARKAGGCGCGCSGNGGMASLASLPWWVYLVAFGLFVALSGDEKLKAVAFGARKRGRRR